jgi:hypothetical protein
MTWKIRVTRIAQKSQKDLCRMIDRALDPQTTDENVRIRRVNDATLIVVATLKATGYFDTAAEFGTAR